MTAGFLGLQRFTDGLIGQSSPALGLGRFSRVADGYQNQIDRYGALIPDPKRLFDLPKGFSYTILSRAGDMMSDGFRVPGAPDGMAAFSRADGKVILIRNHELSPESTFDGPFGVDLSLFKNIESRNLYDAGEGVRPHQGGTTTLIYDPVSRKVEKEFLSLAGTSRNCAGGPTPWDSWITCEETVELSYDQERKLRERRSTLTSATSATPGSTEEETSDSRPNQARTNFNEKNHGYNFEVPSAAVGPVRPVPLTAMGRFNHEAVAVDPTTGIVYQTEDRDDGLIYRFIPNTPGKLSDGGKLQALVIRGTKQCDTRNWAETGKPKLAVGRAHDVEWLDLDNVESPRDDLRTRGYRKGAARFARGEGMWYGKKEIFFACTNGGISKTGQIFKFVPSPFEGSARESETPGQLTLYLEPNNTHLIQACDNVAVAPWGDLLICEDGTDHNFLRGVTPEGKIFTFGDSAYHTQSEICGICFAPNHPTLFINLQRPGLTLAITGPWDT